MKKLVSLHVPFLIKYENIKKSIYLKMSSTCASNQCFCSNISEMNRIESMSYY